MINWHDFYESKLFSGTDKNGNPPWDQYGPDGDITSYYFSPRRWVESGYSLQWLKIKPFGPRGVFGVFDVKNSASLGGTWMGCLNPDNPQLDPKLDNGPPKTQAPKNYVIAGVGDGRWVKSKTGSHHDIAQAIKQNHFYNYNKEV